jgi:hypothetical protein
MSNRQANIEAVRIYRPVATGQVRTTDEAAIIAIVDVIFGVNLLQPCHPSAMWQGPKRNYSEQKQSRRL